MNFSSIAIGILIIATSLTLFMGLFSMAVGKKFNKKYANKLMTLRVTLQIITILLVMFTLYMKNKNN